MKKLLIGVAVVVVLLVVAAVAVPFLISTDTYKAELIAKVKESTGRDFRIDGKVSFSLSRAWRSRPMTSLSPMRRGPPARTWRSSPSSKCR